MNIGIYFVKITPLKPELNRLVLLRLFAFYTADFISLKKYAPPMAYSH